MAAPTVSTPSTALRQRYDRPALAERLLRSPLGVVTQSRYLDPVGIFALKRLFFPLSRLWAAAGIAETSVSRFVEEAQLSGNLARQTRVLGRRLERHRALRQQADEAEQAWRKAFFSPGQYDTASLALIEAKRLDAAHRLTMDRARFAPVLLAGASHRVKWQIPSIGDVEAVYGRYLDNPSAAYAFPDPLPAVEQSGRIAGTHGPEYWIRFASPSQRMGDIAYAKISEPLGVANPPTVIVGNGVCMEPEMMRGMIDAAPAMCELGFRVVEITTPWHARRCPAGWYGGEKFFATAPLGQLDLFSAQVRETAVVIDWCRRNFAGPIALSGISLGAFVAQLVATHAKHWPAAARPDALLLIVHSGSMEAVVLESDLVDSIGIPDALARAGWIDTDLLRWAPLMNPVGDPVMSPAHIVSVLGTVDRVMPVDGGLGLARRWNLPAENMFVMPRGHFGTPMGLVRDDAPLRRLKTVLQIR